MSRPATRPLTIFIAHPSELLTDHRPHGDGLVSFGFLRRLADRGHELHVAAQEVDVRSALPPNLHIYQLMRGGVPSLVGRLTFMLRMRLLFHRLSERLTFDLVQQMNPVYAGLSLSLIGVRTPLVLGTFVPRWHGDAKELEDTDPAWVRHMKHSIGGAITRLQQARADGLLIASPEAISRIAQPGRHQGRIYNVPHGIDIGNFTERDAIPDRPSVLFLANVIYRKGVFTLLEAFSRVARAVPQAELVIAGRGHQLEEVRAAVARMPECAIRVVGHVDRHDVPAMMRQHSVYCLPSYGEPFATSVIEAMACGLPVAATAAGGLPHLITEGGGRLVPVRDPAALADALIEILRSRDLQQAMGRHNRARVVAEFEVERSVDRLESAYASVLHRSAHASRRRDRVAASARPATLAGSTRPPQERGPWA